MRPEYRRAYERYARSRGLTSHGRRKVRREIRRSDRCIRRSLAQFRGVRLTPEIIPAVKAAICHALNEVTL